MTAGAGQQGVPLPARQRFVVRAADLLSWVDELIGGGWEVIAPVTGRGPRRFERIAAATDADLDGGGRTRWSPKEFLFPRCETLLSYSVGSDGLQIQEPPREIPPRVLFGLSPCDAAGLGRLAAVFSTGPGDPYFQARLDATTVVVFACGRSAPECFCTAVGGSPGGEDGSDIHVMPMEPGSYLLRALTDKGRRLIGRCSTAGGWSAGTDALLERARDRLRQVEACIDRQAIPSRAAAILGGSFNDDGWDQEAAPCLGCRVCTTVCPSCSCFDVYDEGTAACGERCRCWDGCTQQLFTAHATGHNPRSTQVARFRQRVMHKFSYFPEDHGGMSMCVGCGRCAALCPAGLDVHQAVMRIAQRMQAGEGALHAP